jgi:ferrous iron transport protein B
MRLALVGQPNSGKSTLFNHLVGYKAYTSNLPGTTVAYQSSEAMIGGVRAEVVDLPGVYSLVSGDEAERETRNYLLTKPVDALINVIDASLLSRSLELTLQLLELGIPTLVCLNMEDEARRKGIRIDFDALSQRLGVPVIGTIAVRGIGVTKAAQSAVRTARAGQPPAPPRYSADVESAIDRLGEIFAAREPSLRQPIRLAATKWLERDRLLLDVVPDSAEARDRAERIVDEIETRRGRTGESLLAAERHALAMELFEAVANVGLPEIGWRDRLDALLMHRLLGIPIMAAILYGVFLFVFRVGGTVEGPIIELFNHWIAQLATVLSPDSIAFFAVRGVLEGVEGAMGIVLPYLLPFLIALSLLEDSGYLPRAGYLVDGLMHRIGLHGTSVIPFILGYGCSVPAVMATRILNSRRDRFITAMLSVMVPCVARATVIYGLVAYFLGPALALLLYVINVVVIALAGSALTRIFPRVTPGLILEIPAYRLPSVRVVASKVWLRIRDFLVTAVPFLVVGSLIMAVLTYFSVDRYLNLIASPITWSLGLPLVLGVPLLFGVLRKELALVMLFQALGTTEVVHVLSTGQIMTYTLFLMFYVPCVATIAVLRRELGWKQTGLVIGSTTAIALVVGLMARGIAAAV